MLCLTTPFLSSQVQQDPQIQSVLAISGVSMGGRRPTAEDAIVEEIVAGDWKLPEEGSTVTFRDRTNNWRAIKPGKDGSYSDQANYIDVKVQVGADSTYILNAKGDSLVYVNGFPRAGDPYSYGYLNLPVRLKAGANELLFAVGRGNFSFSLKAVEKPVWLQTEDVTLPDILTTDSKDLWASITVCNATEGFMKDLQIRATDASNRSSSFKSATIAPFSDRKLAFKIPVHPGQMAGKTSIKVELMRYGKVLDEKNLDMQVKGPAELQKRTFLSGIDSSVQYYAVRPALKPSSSNALVLTLHGASVEALGQAAAYTSKDWATIVAPTNRRPYGFDWEGIGRLDALEVLDLAKKTYPFDPARVDLTGHSMGGHGTWSIGTLYPNLFASISPSAGWISFWSYAGGWTPRQNTPPLETLRRSMNVGDTLGRVNNTLEENVYILHGAVDDNVPVEQARTMKAKLESIHHPHLEYHEQPGANHWWGNQCVDWPPIFSTIESSKLDLNRSHIDFTTQDPSVSATYDWITVLQQIEALSPSHVVADRDSNGNMQLQLDNVASIGLSQLKPSSSLTVNGKLIGPFHSAGGNLTLRWMDGSWVSGEIPGSEKGPARSGPFKQVFNHHFLFVVGTHGNAQENEWALTRAIYDQETMLYRGNGAVDIVDDSDFSSSGTRGRNVILYGNQNTNSCWNLLLDHCPVTFQSGKFQAGDQVSTESDLGGLVLYPRIGDPSSLVGAITGTGIRGFRSTDRLSLFSSGVDYPDWIVFSPRSPERVQDDGFFNNDWSLGAHKDSGKTK